MKASAQCVIWDGNKYQNYLEHIKKYTEKVEKGYEVTS